MPDTTNRAYTYPDSSGSVEIWTHLQALAEDVDVDVAGIITDLLTPISESGTDVGSAAANFATNSANGRLLLGGKLVYVTIDVNTNNSLTATAGNMTDTTCFTLTADYRPSELTGTLFSANAGTGQVQINADGTCVLRTLDVNIAGGGDLRFSHCFIKA
jgi:hypothetical protein